MNKEVFNEAFRYEDGKLFWKIKSGIRGVVGARAGSVSDVGYRIIRLNRKNYKEHRVIWIMHFSEILKNVEIDHIDRVKDNNRIENLRCASKSQNLSNSKLHKNNTSGIKGVSFRKDMKKWCANIQKDNKNFCLGFYASAYEAGTAYQKAAKELFKEFANF